MRAPRSAIFTCAVAAALTVAGVAAARLPGGARYAGKTDEGKRVSLRLSASGRSISSLVISYRVTCDDGGAGDTSTSAHVRLHRDGTFSLRARYTGTRDGSDNRVRLRGRVTRRRASGTFSLTAEGRGPAGTVRCKSSRVRWSARRVP